MRAAAVLGALLAAGCPGQTGTIDLELVTAPGSTIMDGVARLRVTLTEPRFVTEAERTDRGFDLALEVEASGSSGAVIVEGFDATDGLIAVGQSPPFSVTAIDARIVVYVAPPMSIGRAPVALGPVRSEVSGALLSYGAIFAGGKTETGMASDAIAVYNAFDHTLLGGMAMPAPRSGVAIGPGAGGGVYLFGGEADDGTPTGTLWRFATTVAPAGAYIDLGDFPAVARADASMVPLGADRFLITGEPALDFEADAVSPRVDIASLPSSTATVIAADRILTSVFAGPGGIVRYRDGNFDTLAAARSGAGVAALPDGNVVIAGGGDPLDPNALVVNTVTGEVTTIPGFLSTGRQRPAIAATSRHVVVAGGLDANNLVIASADIFDAFTLQRLDTIPIAPRGGTFAIALPNDQVLIAGGDSPNDLIEVFTPSAPALDQGL